MNVWVRKAGRSRTCSSPCASPRSARRWPSSSSPATEAASDGGRGRSRGCRAELARPCGRRPPATRRLAAAGRPRTRTHEPAQSSRLVRPDSSSLVPDDGIASQSPYPTLLLRVLAGAGAPRGRAASPTGSLRRRRAGRRWSRCSSCCSADGMFQGQSVGQAHLRGEGRSTCPRASAARYRDSALRNAPLALVVLLGMMPEPLGPGGGAGAGCWSSAASRRGSVLRDPLGLRLGDIWAQTQVVDGKVVGGRDSCHCARRRAERAPGRLDVRGAGAPDRRCRRKRKAVRIALTYNLRLSDSEEEAEFDTQETVNALAAAIERLGHRLERFEVSGPASRTVAAARGLQPGPHLQHRRGPPRPLPRGVLPGALRRAGLPLHRLGRLRAGGHARQAAHQAHPRASTASARPGWQYVEKARRAQGRRTCASRSS